MSLAPATMRPSTGMRSPAATRTRMPGTSSRARRREGLPSSPITVAVVALKPSRFSAAPLARTRTLSSR